VSGYETPISLIPGFAPASPVSDPPFALAPSASEESPLLLALAALEGRATVLVLWNLFWGAKGFYQLLRSLGNPSVKTLSADLESLVQRGLVQRRSCGGRGRVEFALTPTGETLKLVIGAMYEWGLLARSQGIVSIEKSRIGFRANLPGAFAGL
jgi:DNA-binding HxlR family transcriptional regulator